MNKIVRFICFCCILIGSFKLNEIVSADSVNQNVEETTVSIQLVRTPTPGNLPGDQSNKTPSCVASISSEQPQKIMCLPKTGEEEMRLFIVGILITITVILIFWLGQQNRKGDCDVRK